MTNSQKQELDHFIGYAVKHGALDEDRANEMSYKQKQHYMDWSDFMANNQANIYLEAQEVKGELDV